MPDQVRGVLYAVLLLLLPGCKITPDPLGEVAPPSVPAAAAPATPEPTPEPAPAPILPAPELTAPASPTAPPVGLALGPATVDPAVDPTPLAAADRRLAVVQQRLARLQAWLGATGRRALLLSRPDHYAWLTCGAGSGRLTDQPAPVLVILPDRAFVAAAGDALLAARAELTGLGFQAVRLRWDRARRPDAVVEAVRSLAGEGRLASDEPRPGTELVEAELLGWPLDLTELEQQRLAWLGAAAARVVGRTLDQFTPTETEQTLAARLTAELLAVDVEPLDVRVVALERLARDGLARPGATTLTSGAAVHLTAGRWGLKAIVGRTVAVAAAPAIVADHVRARRLYAALLTPLEPGRPLRELHAAAVRAAAAEGEPRLFDRTPPALVGGYALIRPVGPEAVEALAPRQAVGLTVLLPAAYLADTALVRAERVELITVTADWPAPAIEVRRQLVPVPTLRGSEVEVQTAEAARRAAEARARALEFLRGLVGPAFDAAARRATAPASPPAPEPVEELPENVIEDEPAPPAGARPPGGETARP